MSRLKLSVILLKLKLSLSAIPFAIWSDCRKKHGRGRWRKLKGVATVRLPDNTTCFAEVHWYEAHGIGKRDIKVKRIIGR